MADEQQAGAGFAAFGEQQLEKGCAGISVQGRGWFVGNHQLRLADQGAGGGHPLLLADGQRIGASFKQIGLIQAQVGEQDDRGLVDAAMALAGPLRTQAREMAGQLYVLAHREKRQQVELLEDIAGMVNSEAVAGTGGKLAEVLAEHLNVTALRFLHAAEQAQQGGLATAAGALEEQALPTLQGEGGNVQQLRLAGPGKTEVGQFYQRLAHTLNGRVAPADLLVEKDQKLRVVLPWPSSRPCWPAGPISCT